MAREVLQIRRRRRVRRVGKTGKMVVSAVKKLMKHTGWTARTIVKFIRIEFGMTQANLGRQVSRALKTCVRNGLLQNDSGRYRLTDLAAVSRPSGATIDLSQCVRVTARAGAGAGNGHQPQQQRPLRIHSPPRDRPNNAHRHHHHHHHRHHRR